MKLRDLIRNPHNAGLRCLCGVLGAFTAALLIGLIPVYRAIDQFTGVANVARLLQHVSTALGGLAVAMLFLHLHHGADRARPAVRLRAAIAAVAICAMTTMFALAPVDVSEPLYFGDRYATEPYVLAYFAVFLAFMAYVSADVVRTSLRYARQLDTSGLRLGVRLISASTYCVVVFLAVKAGYLAVRWLDIAVPLDITVPLREGALTTPPALAAMVLATAGIIAPRVRPLAAIVPRWFGRRRRFRRLYPLWRDLYQAVPAIALDPPGARYELPIRRLDYRLYRRVIEIRDGMLIVLPYATPGLATELRERAARTGLSGVQLAAAVEAAVLVDALAARRDGRPAGTAMTSTAPFLVDDFDAEVDWLVWVSRAYATGAVRLPDGCDRR